MDPRAALIKEYYGSLPTDRLKIETSEYGWAFLERLLAGGGELEYGELTPTDTLHKYKLVRVPERRADELIEAHVGQTCNVCLYFNPRDNALFCFNLDNNHRTDNTVLLPETETAVRFLRDLLTEAGCPPLIVASGRGYHLWCRLEAAVANEALHAFMLRCAVQSALAIHRAGGDRRRIKFNFYPDPRTNNTVSLRLFGSLHAKNKVFSRVLGADGLLDEAGSWEIFESHLRERTIGAAAFGQAQRKVEEKASAIAAGSDDTGADAR
jgi:hypothetical protein